MQVKFVDFDTNEQPVPQVVLSRRDEVTKLLNGMRNREPFMCELVGDNGYKLGIGIGADVGCVQYSRVDGEPPYLMASNGIEYGDEHTFMMSGTPTPVDGKFCLPMTKVIDIAGFFVETGRKPAEINWEEI